MPLVAVLVLAACTPEPRLVETPVTSPVPERVDTGELVVAVSGVAGGYNPHHISDQSVVTTALANLVLPSVFRTGPDGVPRLDRTVMSSADVTSYDPYTVTYQIRSDASWSDNAPVAAEDFVYLAEQVASSPGALDAAGYRLIEDINAADSGKTVEVVFAEPYPGWRSLFANLLPAHLLKDAPGGWDGALQDNFPAAAGPYAVKALDTDRGEVVLERNDRYWEDPPTLDRIVLRRTDQPGVVDALDAGHAQVALARLDAVGVNSVGKLTPPVATHTVARPTVSTIAIRPDRPQLTEREVRQAIVALLDREQLVTVGTGDGPAAELLANSHVLAPSQPGYRPTAPAEAGHAPQRAGQLLRGAGYTKTPAGWTRGGEPLDLVIGAPEEREPAKRIAEETQRQLVAAGITAEVVTLPADELYAQLHAGADADAEQNGGEPVDLAVIGQPVGADPATSLASNFGCVPGEDGQPPAPANPLGFCDAGLQPTIDAALTGALSVTDALAAVEPALWRAAVSVPLFQQAETLAIRGDVSGVTPGPPLAGPFAGAAEWRRTEG
ncbi:ABC transporter family substrate-binding protein [Actinophytocola sp. S1-96]|uniref:ABC transporter family substrate-binding protein n=1 Tax=Actinophytocola gossypii TaxID=2812003 RepID=A0ABT2JHY3_9PSEU|nr:ABC transporter family substrate-binding protein [Actinophytocola gossypii]